MRRTLRFPLFPIVVAVCLCLTGTVFAQASGDATTGGDGKVSRHKAAATSSTSADLKELKDAIAAQQQQIQQLQQQIQSRDSAIQQLQQQVGQVQSAATQAQTTAQSALGGERHEGVMSAEEFRALQHDVTDLKAVATTNAAALKETDKRVAGLESPLAIRFKGITLTPGGFLAGETAWRSRATFSGVNTPFNLIPFSSAAQARFSEFYGNGSQSRFSLLAEGKVGETRLTGYAEVDFLGAGVTSNNNQSNSYVLRNRQLWGQGAFHNGWTVTGGQMWSLVTETRKGLDNRAEALPIQIDSQYTAGFSWARQYALRATKNFRNKTWLGVSVENAQTLLAVSGNPSNFVIGGPGTLAGLYNNQANYSSNVSPDFVAKLAFEPGIGHYEIFGVASLFRARIYPNATAASPSAVGAFNNNTVGGGIGANARWMVYQKHIEIGAHFLGGDGVGRYGDASLPDVTVNPLGYEKTQRAGQVLATLEWHSPKWDLYGYGGAEYVGRDWGLNASGKPVGYGSPLFDNTGCGTETLPTAANGYGPGALAHCVGQTRTVIEGTTGFWYKPYNGPKGRLQIGSQYSYLVRSAWVGYGLPPYSSVPPKATIAPTAIENMWFTSFRYYLP